jgi:hypothetical protein
VDIAAIVRRLRAAVKTPIDRAAGKALLKDAGVKRARQAAGRICRKDRLFDRGASTEAPVSAPDPWTAGNPEYLEDYGARDDVPF